MQSPFISICIPAYKRTEYLERLLDSIANQQFKDFEVVVTNDSNDDSVDVLLQRYQLLFPITYIKNNQPLGSPENWNEGIRNAKGKWIKMMHDDDWFANDRSLTTFVQAAKDHPGASFIFSGFNEVDLVNGRSVAFKVSSWWLSRMKKSPLYLFKANFIGHPSTTLVRNSEDCFYDPNLKWVVDIEFYMRFLSKYPTFFAIQEPLVNIGINEDQITKMAFRNPVIEIPEVLYLYYKLPAGALRNIFAYDYYWRFVRNLSLRTPGDVARYAPDIKLPSVIQAMIALQAKWPAKRLKNGVFSKTLMFYSYLRNLQQL